MKRSYLIYMVIVSLSVGGCTQWKKLTNSEDSVEASSGHASISGVWRTNIPGIQHFAFILQQTGVSITADSLMFSHNVAFNGNVEGSISGASFTLIGDEGSQCVNKWTFTGQAVNGTLVVTISGDGNNIPLTSCYPNPIHESFVMTH